MLLFLFLIPDSVHTELELEYLFTVSGVIICEGKKRRISCGRNRVLHIFNANYGRTAGRSVCPSRSIRTKRCYSRKSFAVVKRLCQGKRSCLLRATNRLFGNPCSSTYKYLQVMYKCVYSKYRLKSMTIAFFKIKLLIASTSKA